MTKLYKPIGDRTLWPIGSVFISVVETNPSTWFGGTWEAIEGKFLLACNTTYSAGSTGGSSTNDLSGTIHYANSNYGLQQGSSAYADRQITGISVRSGSSEQDYSPLKSVNNMPPYQYRYVGIGQPDFN